MKHKERNFGKFSILIYRGALYGVLGVPSRQENTIFPPHSHGTWSARPIVLQKRVGITPPYDLPYSSAPIVVPDFAAVGNGYCGTFPIKEVG